MSEVFYNDNAVPAHSFVAVFARLADASNNTSGSDLGSYKVESFQVSRGSKVIDRPSEKGGENGWVGVNQNPTATGTIQTATAATPRLRNGDYFEVNTGHPPTHSTSTAGAERWVICEISDPYEMDGYYKQTATFKRSTFASNITGALSTVG